MRLSATFAPSYRHRAERENDMPMTAAAFDTHAAVKALP